MMLKRTLFLLWIALFTSTVWAQDEPTPMPISPTLAAVQARGQVICGIDEEVFGFGFLNPNTGDISGLQVDFCRALAVASIGEAEAVDYRLHLLDAAPADIIAEGVDVLFHHTFTPTLMQQPGLDIGRAVVFYDGSTVMLEGAGRLAEWAELGGTTVCTVADSASARDFAAQMAQQELTYDEAAFASISEMRIAFFDGMCSAQVLDRSLLEIIRFSTDAPDSYTIWPTPFTRRTLTPLYPYGDEQWGDLVDWTLWGLIQAEKLGVSSLNIDDMVRQDGENAEDYVERVGQPIVRLLDAEVGLGSSLGLANGFMAEVIRQVGNYGEIYDRHLGPDSALPVERGLNALWANGGLLDAPAWQ
jgi:general L-amino acid transport system substrate-binding protein